MVTDKLAAGFFSLFLGSDLAFGKAVYTGVVSSKGKKEAKCWTEKAAPTVADWKGHLEGRSGIGIIPIASDNKVTWGAIDVDIYGMNHIETLKEIREKHLPLVPCFSKSGGLHLFLFCKTWVPAEAMMTKLDSLAAVLGFGTCEIFPKQGSVCLSAETPDYGNWINMPYYGSEDRVAIGPDLVNITSPEDFLVYAESKRLAEAEFLDFNPSKATDSVLPGGPPCLNLLWEKKDHSGHRNVLLANTAVYLKKAFPDVWGDKLEEYNRRLSEPLSSKELETLKKSYARKDYRYQCHDCNLKPFCNASECKLRAHGIADAASLFVNNRSMTKINTTPPIWFLDVKDANGQSLRMSLSTEELQYFQGFQKRCMEVLNVMPPPLKGNEWQLTVSKMLEHVAVVEVPPEATPRGRFLELLSEFLERREDRDIDCLRRGAPFADKNFMYFRFTDLQQWLFQRRFNELVKGQLIEILQGVGGTPGRSTIGGITVRFWTLPLSWESGSPEAPLKVDVPPPDPF